MGRAKSNPMPAVAPVTSKKQLLDITGVCQFLGGISVDALNTIRKDTDLKFPQPLQILGGKPLWSVEQLEAWVSKQTKLVEKISA